MTTSSTALQEAVAAMGHHYFDVTMICTTDDYQAEYWMDVLSTGLLSSENQKVLAVSEDWIASGGAGNGLGTLYAWTKACALAATRYNQFDLAAELAAGNVSAALYHTAGKGTRMAPLPASENNNKPGVKLPFGLQQPDGSVRSVSVLEAVIRQTGIYAATRKGRLSVFWGDQVFLPTASFTQPPTHHADILCTLLGETAPTAEEWSEQGLEKYGVIAVVESTTTTGTSAGKPLEAAQVEKVSHETATQMLGQLGNIRQVGPSLGSFSVSSVFLQALCTEYDTELKEKVAKLDTDPHFWMPLTLPEPSYISLMKQKGTDEDESKAHYHRMSIMKSSFLENVMSKDNMGLFGAVDVGKGACWWDYGLMKLYSANTLLLLEKDTAQSDLLRQFLGLETSGNRILSSSVGTTTIDDTTYLFSSKIGTGTIKESLLSNVATPSIESDGAIIVNCASTKSIIAGKGCILYNIIDETGNGIVAEPGQVIVGVTDVTGTSFLLQSRIDIDGGKAWKEVLDMNTMSFEDVHKKNFNSNIGEIARKRNEKFLSISNTI